MALNPLLHVLPL